MESLLPYLDQYADYIWTPEVYQVMLKHSKLNDRCLKRLLAFAPILDFTQMIKLYQREADLVKDTILLIGKYYRTQPNHRKQTLTKINILAQSLHPRYSDLGTNSLS